MLTIKQQERILKLYRDDVQPKQIAERLKLHWAKVYAVINRGHVQDEYGGRCEMCGGVLPCETCARRHRELEGLVGQEPVNGEHDLDLSPEVAAAAAEVRSHWGEKEFESRQVTKSLPGILRRLQRLDFRPTKRV